MTFDAAIIGGGLAGTSAAIHLARQGVRVVLLEAKTYPHHKVCGEFFSPECRILLDDLGVRIQPVLIDTAEITAPDGTSWESPFPDTAIGISRYVIDQIMAEQAQAYGAEVREATPVTGIEGSLKEDFTLHTRSGSIQARTVIAAHGKRSSFDRALNRPFMQKAQPFVALKNHFYGAPLPNRVELHVFPGGYCGMSEVENGMANVCLLVQQDVFQRHGAITPFITWMQTQNPRLHRWLSSAEPVHEWLSIAQVPFVRKNVVQGDMLMTGDAAGLITPLAGSGMGMALQGGLLAADYTSQYLNGTLQDLAPAYSRAWQQKFSSRLRLGRFLQHFMLEPRLLTPGLHLMNKIPPLGKFLLNHTRDYQMIRKAQ
jgi:flavin-dependent dehydrogenase